MNHRNAPTPRLCIFLETKERTHRGRIDMFDILQIKDNFLRAVLKLFFDQSQKLRHNIHLQLRLVDCNNYYIPLIRDFNHDAEFSGPASLASPKRNKSPVRRVTVAIMTSHSVLCAAQRQAFFGRLYCYIAYRV